MVDKIVCATALICGEHLTSLSVGDCVNITDKSMEYIAKYCPFIEKLVVWGASISDRGIKVIVENCPRIQIFELSLCELLTDISLEYVSALPSLRILDIAGCTRMSFDGVMNLGKRMLGSGGDNQLERVSIGGLKNVNEESFNVLMKVLCNFELFQSVDIYRFLIPFIAICFCLYVLL